MSEAPNSSATIPHMHVNVDRNNGGKKAINKNINYGMLNARIFVTNARNVDATMPFGAYPFPEHEHRV